MKIRNKKYAVCISRTFIWNYKLALDSNEFGEYQKKKLTLPENLVDKTAKTIPKGIVNSNKL